MEWFKIFPTEAEARARLVESKPQLVILSGKRVCLALFEGKFYAVQDACTHNAESLSKGIVNYLGEIVCPWHHYRFDLATGRACDSTCGDLKSFPIRIDSDGFFIGV
jgi:nitrite reductase/ring-hydroxylating ferredoxin subunit